MRHSTYQQQMLAHSLGRRRGLNPVAVANPEWMAGWWARYDEFHAHVEPLLKAGRWAEYKAFADANPTVPITEESVQSPVPALQYPPAACPHSVLGGMAYPANPYAMGDMDF